MNGYSVSFINIVLIGGVAGYVIDETYAFGRKNAPRHIYSF